MAKLADVLLESHRRSQLVRDCHNVLDAEVADKGGLGGVAIKAGYKVVQGIKPGFVPKVIDDLLPEFAAALDPLFDKAQTAGQPAGQFFPANSAAFADALLAITDRKAKAAKSGVAVATYNKLRPTAKKHVESAAGRVGELVDQYCG